ncbi:MAG: hypothetical protein FWG51_01660 [Firmicutes bacterium]|nr:hypothetical protein [Bacillota bacterium]
MKNLTKKTCLLLALILCIIAFCSCNTPVEETTEPFSEIVNVVILTEFQDAVFEPEDFEIIEDSLNNPESTSVKQYFSKVSYGNLTVKSVYAFAQSNMTRESFKELNTTQQVAFAKNTLQNQTIYKDIHKSEIFEEKLDNKKRGYLDSVVFYVPWTVSNTGSDPSSALWPHTVFYSANIKTFNGLNFKDFVIFPHNVQLSASVIYTASVGVMCHELLHVLGNDLGISDLYYYDDPNVHPVGLYDIMAYTDYAAPQQLNMYYKSLLGWATLTDLNYGEIEVAKTDATAIKLGERNGEFFLIQYFEESEICGIEYGEGFLIYRINTNIKNGNVDKTVGEQVFIFRTDKLSVNYNAYNFPAIFDSDTFFEDLTYSDGTKASFEIFISFDGDNFYVEVL